MISLLFLLTFIAHLFYLYSYQLIFMINSTFRFVFDFISTFLLLASFYSLYKQKYSYCVGLISIYGLSYMMFFFISIIINGNVQNKKIMILLALSIVIILFYLVYCMHIYMDYEIKQKNYILEIENTINNHYIHRLTHDYNDFIYKIKNAVEINDKEKALDIINDSLNDHYTQSFISNNSNFNKLFLDISKKYDEKGINFSYFMNKIDQKQWNEKNTAYLYYLLELFKIKGNDVIVVLSNDGNNYCIMIQSLFKIDDNKLDISYRHIEDSYIYTLKLPLNK